MRTVTKFTLCLAALLVAVMAQPGFAQNVTTGALSGIVMDAQKGVLPGATVTAVHTPTGTTYEAVTAADGHYSFVNIRVGGPYSVTVNMPGFRKQAQTNVTVSLGEERKVDFTLQLESVQETVNVTAEAPLVDPARAGTAANVSNDALQTLPTVNRSLYDYARLSPHFVINPVGTDASSISVAGRNDRYNNIQIDGAVNNDVFGLASSGTPGGQTSTEPISLDAIQELQLVVSAYDVRQGGFSGGSVNAITKSGTNRLHGTAYYFGRNQDLVGKGPNDREFGQFSNKQFGASIGGPILQNRLFYFGNFEIGRKETPSGTSVSGSGANFGRVADVDRFINILKNKYGYDPGSKDEFTKTTNSDKIFVRSDMNFGRHQLTVRHNYVKGINDIAGNNPNVNVWSFSDNFYRMNSKTNSTVGQLNSTLGSAFNELRVTYQQIRDFRNNPRTQKPFPQVKVTLSDNSSIFAGTEEFSTANELDQDVIELTDDVTLVRGKHTITVGTHNEFYKFRNLFIRDNYGYYQFASLDLLEQGLAQSYDYSFGTNDPEFAARFSVRQFGLYAGDQWRVKNNLSVTYGIRFDTPSFPDKPSSNPLALQYFNYGTDVVPVDRIWSPRAGFNWQVSDKRREQVRGGIGIFSGRTPYVWLSNQYGNTGIEITRLRVSYDAKKNRVPFVADALNQPASVGSAQTNEIDLVDPDYKYPRVIRGNIAYDRELGFWGLVGIGEFIYTRNVQDVKYQNLNYVQTGATRPDGRPVFERKVRSLSDAIFLTNSDEGKSWSGSFKLEKPWKNGFMASASYLYNRSWSIMDGTSSQAASNWGYNLTPGDPNNTPLTVSNYDARHRINVSASYQFPVKGINPTVSLFYNGQSGRPYSMVLYAAQDLNGDGRNTNDLLYVPRSASDVVVTKGTADQLMAWLAADPCVNEQAGSIMERNSCRQPWTNQVDFRVAANVPLGGDKKIELEFNVFNFLNMFGKDYGKVQYRSNNYNSDIRYDGIDSATGLMTYNISALNPTNGSYQRWYVDDVRSRWQAQFGARFRF